MRKTVSALCVFLSLMYIGSIGYYYRFPKFFEIKEQTTKKPQIEGIVYIDTLIRITEDMNANWMPNDIFFWPTRLMDNPQNFQLGELEAVRYATRILRDRLSRMSSGEHRIEHHTPWFEIDDNFYYAQGELFVIRELVYAVKQDFTSIITQRKAGELVDAIIEVLDTTQFRPWIVTNGETGSLLANHSLQLQARLEEVRQKMAGLENIL